MNLYLHNIGDIYGNVPITLGDALLTDPGYRVDYVLTNPPFGKSLLLLSPTRKANRRKKTSSTIDRISGQPVPINN